MNTYTKKILLLALSLLTGNSLIKAMLPNTTAEHYERVRANALKTQNEVNAARQTLFVQQPGNIFSFAQSHPDQWVQLKNQMLDLSANFTADKKTFETTMNNLINPAVNTLSMTLGTQASTFREPNATVRKTLEPHVKTLETSSLKKIQDAERKLLQLFEKILAKRKNLQQQLRQIRNKEGLYTWYASEDRREKDRLSKTNELAFVSAEEAVTELYLKYVRLTLSAITRIINDFKYVNPGAGVPVLSQKLQ